MENADEKRIIEINGIKMEVDLRYAKRVDSYRVGDSVKALIRNYGDSFTAYPGVIVGFTEFQNRPCIDLLYLKQDGEVAFKSITKDDKDTEIAPFNQFEEDFDKVSVLEKLNRQIEQAEEAVRMTKAKKEAFLKFFRVAEPKDE